MANLDFKLRHRHAISKAGERIHILLHYRDDLAGLVDLGFQVSSVAGDVAAGSIPLESLEQFRDHSQVVYIEASRSMKDEMDVSAVAINLVDPSTGRRNVPGGGRGAIIGIIDSGFDLTHPCFQNVLGRTRIMAAWDQAATVNVNGAAPDGFDYGVEYTREAINRYADAGKILVTRNSTGTGGHGTIVAGIAAGNGEPYGIFRGVAPEADLILVTYKNAVAIGGSAFVLDAIKYIEGLARSVVRPVVINLSQGDDLGAHDGTSLLERAIDNIVQEGRTLVVKSAGNGSQRPAKCHAHGEVSADHDFVLPFALMPTATNPVDGDTIELWYRSGDRLAVALKTPSGSTSTFIPAGKSDVISFAAGLQAFVYSDLKHPTNGDNHIGIVFEKGTGWETGTWELILHGEEVSHGEFDAWADRSNGSTSITFKRYQSDANTVTIPGNARRAIAVGGFVSRPTESGDSGEVKGTLSMGSSLGPTRDGRIKPDLMAPSSLISVPKMRREGCPEYYAFDSGTSMSAPHVAGAIALLWALWPESTADQIQDALFSTARQDAFTGTTPNSQWGYGKLDVGAAYEMFSNHEGNGETKMNQTCEFQLTIKNKKGQRTPVRVQIELNGVQVVGIRGLDTSGMDAYDISLKVTKRGTAKVGAEKMMTAAGGPANMMAATGGGGDECYECQKPNTPCPPHDLVEVPCT